MITGRDYRKRLWPKALLYTAIHCLIIFSVNLYISMHQSWNLFRDPSPANIIKHISDDFIYERLGIGSFLYIGSDLEYCLTNSCKISPTEKKVVDYLIGLNRSIMTERMLRYFRGHWFISGAFIQILLLSVLLARFSDYAFRLRYSNFEYKNKKYVPVFNEERFLADRYNPADDQSQHVNAITFSALITWYWLLAALLIIPVLFTASHWQEFETGKLYLDAFYPDYATFAVTVTLLYFVNFFSNDELMKLGLSDNYFRWYKHPYAVIRFYGFLILLPFIAIYRRQERERGND